MKKRISIVLPLLIGVVVIFCIISFASVKEKNVIQKQVFGEDQLYQNVLIPITGLVFELTEKTEITGESSKMIDEKLGRNDVAELVTGSKIEWNLDIQEEGVYQISLGYLPIAGKSEDIQFNVLVDGKPVYGVETLAKVSRLWRSQGEMKRTSAGNDLRPKQEEVFLWSEQSLYLPNYQSIPLKLTLPVGNHEISLEVIKGSLYIDYLRLFKEEAVSYEDYATNEQEIVNSDFILKIQGEDAYLKSISSLCPIFDRTSPLTEPYHPTQMRLNTIGGKNWEKASDWLAWKFEVPEDGYYKIGMRYHQNLLKGANSTRSIYIDGQIIFDELREVEFPYGVNWDVKTLGTSDDNPYMIYLTKGLHEIKMEVSLGRLSEVLQTMNDTLDEINGTYQAIMMVTGTRPDVYRDYELDVNIPGLTEEINKCIGELTSQKDSLELIYGENSSSTKIVVQLIRQLESFQEDTYTIPKRLESFRNNITAMADWLLNITEQPLEIDYIYVASKDQEEPRGEANMMERVGHELRAFIGSFTQDYNVFSETGSSGEEITVWLALGRDQAYIIKRLIDESFTPETGINVDLNLVQNALLKATIAGQGPDISLFTRRGEIMNLAFRDALEPLNNFEGFEVLTDNYMENAFIPYTYDDNIYAVPEDQEFFMMFYRKDILEELGVEPPKTWVELMEIAPVLQMHHMQIGLPYENVDAYSLLNRGVGILNLYPTLLYQNNTALYTDDHTGTNLGEQSAYNAFKQWTDFYSLYDYPLYKSDFSRFRVGEMPITIASYDFYTILEAAAPEIKNEWAMVPIPGTIDSNGNINNASCANGNGNIILKSCENKEAAWKFLQWWNSTETQSQFARDMEAEMGVLGRYLPANLEAFKNSYWGEEEQAVLLEQWEKVEEIPEIPGGYYTSRNLDNAFRDVVLNWDNPRESLYYWNKSINDEITRKLEEMIK